MRGAQARSEQGVRVDLARPVLAPPKLRHPCPVDVEAGHLEAGARKRDRDRQTHVAEADDGHFPTVDRHLAWIGQKGPWSRAARPAAFE